MLSKVHSLGLAGIAGYGVETECYIGTGLPAFELLSTIDLIAVTMQGLKGEDANE